MKILAIKSITTKAGRPMILVQTAEKDMFITVKQWQSKGCSSILDSYVGGDIEADYYQEGDKMINDTVCTKNDTVLRDFSVSVNPVVSARALAAESELRMSNALNASALFARNKADKTVEETKVEPTEGELQN